MTRRLDRLASPDPSPEDLVADMDEIVVVEQVDRDCRYAQKVARKRKRLLQWAMKRLPAPECEAVRLSLRGKSQKEIAEIQGVAQYTVCERLQRAQARMVWLCTVGSRLSSAELWKATEGVLRDEDRRILIAWWQTGSQSAAARKIYGSDALSAGNKKQMRVRDGILYSIGLLRRVRGFGQICDCLESLWDHKQLLDNQYDRKPKSAA